jgi:hypothetical protein
MKRLKLLSAVAMLTAILPLVTSSLAAAQGPGPCTRPGNMAVGPEGPAMNGGQLMAGYGQCRSIGSWYNAVPIGVAAMVSPAGRQSITAPGDQPITVDPSATEQATGNIDADSREKDAPAPCTASTAQTRLEIA